MLAFILDPAVWLDLFILTILEIVLGVDNIVFIILTSARLAAEKQKAARRFGLILAMIMRLLLLALIFWLAHLTKPLFSIGQYAVSTQDLIELSGGLFLVIKSVKELIAHRAHGDSHPAKQSYSQFWLVISQIVLIDLILSLDSVITAVAIAQNYIIMALAIIIAIAVMMAASEPVSYFIKRYPRVKLLALLLILFVGLMLMIKGFNIEFSEWNLYIAIFVVSGVILPPWRRWFKL
jgi:predicted tellurium resistance membrane protein TerC